MTSAVRAVLHHGQVQLLENLEAPEGTRLFVLVCNHEDASEQDFWHSVSRVAADEIWANPEDDIYAQLLEK